MKDCKNQLLFLLLILVFLYLYYNNNKIENFTDSQPAQCYNPKFTTEGEGNDMKFCTEIDGVGHGCQSFDVASGRDRRLAAFSIFGSYIDNLNPNDVNKCMEPQGQTLSEWGLCDKELIKQIRDFKYDDNEARLEAIESACQFYEKAYKN